MVEYCLPQVAIPVVEIFFSGKSLGIAALHLINSFATECLKLLVKVFAHLVVEFIGGVTEAEDRVLHAGEGF